jgi:hypothetical protein
MERYKNQGAYRKDEKTKENIVSVKPEVVDYTRHL